MVGFLVLVILFQIFIGLQIHLNLMKNFKFLIPFALLIIPSFLAIFYGLAT